MESAPQVTMSNPETSTDSGTRVRKRQKVGLACDSCRRKKIKCDGVPPECGPCRTRSNGPIQCTWTTSSSQGLSKADSEYGQHQSLQTTVSHNAQPQFQSIGAGGAAKAYTLDRHNGQGEVNSRQGDTGGGSVSAMIGAVEGSTTQGVFGDSSAGNFITQIRRAVAARTKGTRTPTGPGKSDSYRRENCQWDTMDLDECALPPRSRADVLMDVYWNAVHPIYPFVDKVAMTTEYQSLFTGEGTPELDASLICTLNIIFALSCQLDTTISAIQRQTSAGVFIKRAQDLLDIWRIPACLESVQVLLLLSQYLQSTNEPLQCWLFVGFAVRIAQCLGLHLSSTTANEPSPRRREMMRRAWQGCVLLDRFTALSYGRPCMISREMASTSPLPSIVDEEHITNGQQATVQPNGIPARMAFFAETLQLYVILEELLSSSYSGGARDDFPTYFALEAKLAKWESQLPAHLKVEFYNQQIPASATDGVFMRQAVVLRQRFLHIRILTLRPILSSYIAPDPVGQVGNSAFLDAITKRLAHECSQEVITVAQEAIELVRTYRSSDFATTGLVSAWWYCVLFVYTAATVLIASRLRPFTDHSDNADEGIKQSWRHALEILSSYSGYSDSIPDLISTLQILWQEVPERYSQSRTRMEYDYGHTHASASYMPTLDMPDQSLLYHDATAEEILGNFEFSLDPADLSWLNTVPLNF